MYKRNDERWNRGMTSFSFLTSRWRFDLPGGSELQYRLMVWETGAMMISIRLFLSLLPAWEHKDSPRRASTLVEAVIWFRGLIFSIGGELTFQSAVNSAVVRGWSGRGHPSMMSVGISLRVRIVLPSGIVMVKKCFTWYLKEYTFYIWFHFLYLILYLITLVLVSCLIL